MKQTTQAEEMLRQTLAAPGVFARAEAQAEAQAEGAEFFCAGGRELPLLSVNERARVIAIRDRDRRIETRLRDIGFSEGSEVVCVGRSPLGDPTAFAVRGAVIALRAEDAACVLVEERKEREGV